MRSIPLFLFVFTILIVNISCEKADPLAPVPIPLPPTVRGEWFGNLMSAPVRMTLAEVEGSITGYGIIQGYDYAANGSNKYPDVIINMGVQGYYPFTFVGKFVSQNTLSGKVSGSGFYNSDLVLTRQ